MGVEFTDYNNDGLPDLVVTDLANQMYAVYRNNGDGMFSYDTYPSGLARISLTHSGWGVRFLDYDNDGWKDLMIAQGHDLDTIELTFPNLHYREPMLLARNTGNNFVDVSAEAGAVFQQPWVARGVAAGDIDDDGRVDAVVTTNGESIHVLHNDTKTPYHWLTLRLIGHKSNRDAIGALVKLTSEHGAQFATVTTAGSYLSSSDKRLHFGLGEAVAAKLIEIQWPSGIRQTLQNVRGDQILSIDEPSAPNAKQ
jgi:enediyne biosynthesis protein E4